MGIPSAYSKKAISANDIKNDSTTLLNAGNVNPALANNQTLAENASSRNNYGSVIVKSTSPTTSGNVGIGVAISNGTVNQNTDGNYIAIMLGTKIAGVTTTLLRNSASDVGQYNMGNYYNGYRREGLNTWNSNHIITKGPGAGDKVEASGFDGRTGKRADDAIAYPGELTFMAGDSDPTNYDYHG